MTASTNVEALFKKAVMQQEAGNLRQASELCQTILEEDPKHVETLKFFASMKLEGQAWDEALPYLERAEHEAANDAAIVVNMGVVFKNKGQLDKAMEYYQRAVALAPNSHVVYNNLGNLYRDQGRLEEALDCFHKSIAINNRQARSYKNLGLTLRDLHRSMEAMDAFQKALDCDPSYNELYSLLGDVLEMEGFFRKAILQYQNVLATEPSNGAALFKLALCLPIMYPTIEFMEEQYQLFYERIEALYQLSPVLRDPFHEVGKTNFMLAYFGKNDVEIQKKLAACYLKANPDLAWIAPHCQKYQAPNVNEKIKVGFVSAYFKNHTVGKLLCGLISQFDRTHFEVSLFTTGDEDDEVRRLLRQSVNHFIVCPNDTEQSRMLIASSKLDVLIHAGVMLSPWNYFLAFARLAPLQCVTWGHPVTTGIPNMDYFISSEHLESVESHGHYSEKLLKLRDLNVYYLPLVRNVNPKSRVDLGFPLDKNIYFCPQTLFKMHPEFDSYLSEILDRDPNGLVILVNSEKNFWNNVIKERLKISLNSKFEKVMFIDKLSHPDFLDALACADVVLDTIHFSGGFTSFEAIMVGTPIVTQPSPYRRARISNALLQEIGVTETIANDKASYIELAVKLGTDKFYRQNISGQLNENSHRLLKNENAVRELEDFLKTKVGSGVNHSE